MRNYGNDKNVQDFIGKMAETTGNKSLIKYMKWYYIKGFNPNDNIGSLEKSFTDMEQVEQKRVMLHRTCYIKKDGGYLPDWIGYR